MKNTKLTGLLVSTFLVALLLFGCDGSPGLVEQDGGPGGNNQDGGGSPLDSGIDAGQDLDAGADTDSETVDTDTRSSCEKHAEIIAEGTTEACSGKDGVHKGLLYAARSKARAFCGVR